MGVKILLRVLIHFYVCVHFMFLIRHLLLFWSFLDHFFNCTFNSQSITVNCEFGKIFIILKSKI